MSHECDGDCQATAEWRQQQIRDLTERAERAEAAVNFKQGLIEDISRDCERAEAKVFAVEALADKLWAESEEIADTQNAVRLSYRHVIAQFRAALGDAS